MVIRARYVSDRCVGYICPIYLYRFNFFMGKILIGNIVLIALIILKADFILRLKNT